MPEAIARANADILDTRDKQLHFISLYEVDRSEAREYLKTLLV